MKKLAMILEFSIDTALGIEINEEDEEEEDKYENLIIGGLIIGTAISLVLKDYYILGTVVAFIGLGLGYILKVFKKDK